MERALARTLFTRTSSTAIAYQTGAAKSGSLRSMEVVVPVTLEAWVRWQPEARQALDADSAPLIRELAGVWVNLLDQAAGIVLAVGGHRSDGYGRAILAVRAAAAPGGRP
jgi:hypothetical protein